MHTSHTGSSRKIRVGILFGGKSAEHEVSLRSAKNVLQAIDTDKFEPVLVGIGKDGRWHYAADQAAISGDRDVQLTAERDGDSTVTLMPGSRDGALTATAGPDADASLDVVFPILHGPMGEDGSIQGFLELANLPYVGPGILGSAIGMDKDVMKRLLRDAGIAVADFEVVRTAALSPAEVEKLLQRLGLPLFVKPANMGSSVGVTKVNTAEDLLPAIADALRFDLKVLVERAIVGDEIECAVLGNDDPQASVIGRVIPTDGFYSYEAKYIDDKGAALEIPADISPEVSERARAVAIQVFNILSCEGMSRVDMFATKDGSIVVNEINTIPGFTKISMYPKLWEVSGLTYTDLITRLIELAIARFERRQKLATTYDGHM
jgi:D-alanine-D-alanine ligase